MTRSHLFRFGSVILLSFCLFRTAWWFMPDILGVWELQAEDQFMHLAWKWQGSQPVSPDIVHIDLDDQSVADIPFSKNDPRLYAELIRILAAAGVKTILVDIMFPSCKEESCSQLAGEVRNAGNVFFPVILTPTSAGDIGQPAENPFQGKIFWPLANQNKLDLSQGKILMANFSLLNDAAAGLGHINCPPDPDGVYRRFPLFIQTAGGIVPSLALRTVCFYLGIQPQNIHLENDSSVILANVTLPSGRTLDIEIPVGSKMDNRVNFSGPWNTSFAHYSFATVLTEGGTPVGRQNLMDELEDSLAIVSDVSTGGRDFGPVPLSSYSPLSNLHAHFINSLLTDNFLAVTDYRINLLIDIFLILLLTLAAMYVQGYRFALVSVILFCGYLAICLIIFLEYRILIPIVRPSVSLVTAGSCIMLLQFLEVQKEKQFIRATLTHYFAPSLMEKILNEPDLIKGVSKKELTVLFSDIVGFTSWSSTKDAVDIHRTLNRYFSEMAEIVFAHDGTIDKYIGDGLMVFFGDPTPCPDHALRAVRTALAMQKKTAELRKEWKNTGGMPIEIRVGIHTGEMVVGNMGSSARMDYTVIGSNVNLAQRLESSCPPSGILISEQVFRQLNGAVAAQAAGTIQAKGFSEPVSVYTINLE